MNDVIDNDTGEIHEIVPTEMSGAVAAEISQQVATAKRYPRRSDKAISTEIMSRATLDEETAAECCYTLPRAGKDIVGPSVRFAELVLASYGNLRAGARFVEIDTKDPARSAVVIEGVCIDLQMNNGVTIPVRRSITGKRGVFNADMTNIAFSAGAAIARREAIIKTVPKSIWGAAWKGVLAVLQGDQKTLAARRRGSIEAFQKMGVAPERVFEALQVSGEEAISLEHMPRLIGMWTALRDGTETIESLFGRGGSTHETVQNPLKDDPKPETLRGAAATTAAADKVVAPDGTVTKDRDGESGGKPAAAQEKPAANTTKTATVESGSKPDPISSGITVRDGSTAEVGADGKLRSNEPETASNDGAKSDKTPEATGATGEVPAGAAAIDQPAEKTAQAASPAPAGKQYDDAESYMTFMRDTFDRAKSKALVDDTWRATRADRNEFLSPEQIDELTKDKEAKLKSLKLKGSDT